MPKVSVLGGAGPAVRPVGTPYQNVRFADVGQAIGQGLGDVGHGLNAASEAAAAAQKELDDVRTDEALLELERQANTRMYDSKTGFMNQMGINAVNTGGALGDIGKAKQKLFDGLETERQRMRFEKLAGQRVESWRLSMEKHAGDQYLKHLGTQSEGAKLQAETEAINAPDLDTADAAIERAIVADKETGEAGAVRRFLQKQGLTPEQMALREDQYRAEVYGKAINAKLAKGDVAGAKAALDKWSAKITDPRIRKDVQDAFDAVETETAVSAVIGESMVKSADGKVTYPWIDEAAALKKIDEKYPPGPKRDEAKKRLDYRIKENEQLRVKAGADKMDEAISEYYASGKRLNSPRMLPIRNWLLDPANGATEHWRNLERGDYNDRMQSRAMRDRSDMEAIRDFGAKTTQQMAEANIEAEYFKVASKMARDQMRAMQNQARERVKKGLAFTDADFETKLDSVVKSTPGLKTSKQKQAALKASMKNWRLNWANKHKEDPTLADVEQELGRQLEWGEETDGFLNSNKFRFEAENAGEPFQAFDPVEQKYKPSTPAPVSPTPAPVVPGPAQVPQVPGVPEADAAQCAEALRAKGKAVTPEAIRAAYDRIQKRKAQ